MRFNLLIASLISVSVVGVIICFDTSSENELRFKPARKTSVFSAVCNLGSLCRFCRGSLCRNPLWVEIQF